MLMAMARKLSGSPRRVVEICWVPGCYSSRQLFLRNPWWGDRRGAGQALRSAGTLEGRHGAVVEWFGLLKESLPVVLVNMI